MANLNKEQARAVEHINGPCLVLAGPGSGKTFTLVERIRHLIEDISISPSEILVITFSKKAAVEMQERFESLTEYKGYPVFFGTFHAVFYSIVKAYYGYGKNSILLDKQKISYLKYVLKKLKVNENEEYIETIINKISHYKTLRGNEERIHKFLQDEFIKTEDAEMFIQIFNMYDLRCKSEHKLDFDDMLYMCYEILSNNRNVLEKYRNIYKYILVDEFQDINDIQYKVLKLLAGDNNNIFAVGDDDQSIYGFRGSNPELMNRFIEDNPNIKIIDMNKNYRCSECVIDSAGKLIKLNKTRINKSQNACKVNKEEGSVNIVSIANANAEADFVCEHLLKMREGGIPLSNAAILYRTNRCSGILEEKLDSLGIKFSKRGNITNFYNYEWVKDIIAYLKIAVGKYDESTVLRIINKPDREQDRDEVMAYLNGKSDDKEELINLFSKIKMMSEMTPFASVTYVLKALKYEEYIDSELIKRGYSEDQIKYIKNEILERSKLFMTINSWLEHIKCFENTTNDNRTATTENNVDNVNLMTAHASKGLEFDTVFIIGLQEGIFPSNKMTTEEQIEEERRLLYVAMTRAKKHLFIIGRGEARYGKKVSRFVAEITE